VLEALSEHAHKRARQRGIEPAHIGAILTYADRAVHRGGGAEYVWISKTKLSRLGPKTPEGVDCDRLRNLHVLVASDATVITVVRVRQRQCRRTFN
jgi:hypothetical protein